MEVLRRSVSWHIRNAAVAMAVFILITIDVLHSGPLTEIDANIARWNRPELPDWADWNHLQLGSPGITWSYRALPTDSSNLSWTTIQDLAPL